MRENRTPSQHRVPTRDAIVALCPAQDVQITVVVAIVKDLASRPVDTLYHYRVFL
jgi:hypothetical protein